MATPFSVILCLVLVEENKPTESMFAAFKTGHLTNGIVFVRAGIETLDTSMFKFTLNLYEN
jgi:hypothetical protein